MSLFDRYVLRLFIKVLFVCFFSLAGLFIVVDATGNLDEFLSYGKSTEGGLLWVLFDYYGARVLSFFDRLSPVLALVAAVFAFTWMQRNNEWTAVMAAGIKPARIIRPVLWAVICVSLLGVVNREIFIPSHGDKLTRNAQDWLGDQEKSLRPRFDHKSDILIGGRKTIAAKRQIIEPMFRCFTTYGTFGNQINAKSAVYHPPQDDRPGGYLLNAVQQPSDLSQHKSALAQLAQDDEPKPVILSPSDTAWLKKKQLFIASEVSFNHLVNGASMRQHASSLELWRGLRNPSLDYGSDVKVVLHSRLLQPFLDVTMLFLGLPLVLTRQQKNIFVAAGSCMLLISAFFIVTLSCHALGGSNMINPALAAWCPLFIFAPIAYAMMTPQGETHDTAPQPS